ncbi:MAG: glycosyltransferase family 39 protein [Planctomycetes bacterium]|nr:glycosyltransferase family 39 protein [Planctomycetota bacterium]
MAAVAASPIASDVPHASARIRALNLKTVVLVLAGLAIVLGLAWRLTRYFLRFPIWGDEAFICLNLPGNTFLGLSGELRFAQVAPILYLWSELIAYDWLGSSEIALRLSSLLAGIGGLGLFAMLARRVLDPRAALLSVAILAVSYTPVRHACEIKPYAFDLFFTVALLLPAVAWLQERRLRWLAWLTLVTPLALLSSYPAVFVSGAISVALLLSIWKTPGWAVKWWFMALNVMMLLAFFGHYLLVGRQQMSPQDLHVESFLQGYWKDWLPEWDLPSIVKWLVASHTGRMFGYPIGDANGASAAIFLLFLYGGWTLWRSGRKQLLALLTLPFLLSMAAAILHKYPYGGSGRLAQHLAPSICLLLAAGLVAIIEKLRPVLQQRTLACVYVALAAIAVAGTTRDVRKPYKSEMVIWYWNLLEELKAKASPDDSVVFVNDPNDLDVTLQWYVPQIPNFAHRPVATDPAYPKAAKRYWRVHFTFVPTAFPEPAPPGRSLFLEDRRAVPLDNPTESPLIMILQGWTRQ